jgi:hypothetical protein
MAAALGLILVGTGVFYVIRQFDNAVPPAPPRPPTRLGGVTLKVPRPARRQGYKLWPRVWHTITSKHPRVTRYPLGGFRCLDCGHVGADFEEMGTMPSGGYVSPGHLLDRQGNDRW